MKDEGLGYWDPRPWHRDRPQRPKVWKREDRSIWGPPPTPEFEHGRFGNSGLRGGRKASPLTLPSAAKAASGTLSHKGRG